MLLITPDEETRRATLIRMISAAETSLLAFKDKLPEDIESALTGSGRLILDEKYTNDIIIPILEANPSLFESFCQYELEPSED